MQPGPVGPIGCRTAPCVRTVCIGAEAHLVSKTCYNLDLEDRHCPVANTMPPACRIASYADLVSFERVKCRRWGGTPRAELRERPVRGTLVVYSVRGKFVEVDRRRGRVVLGYFAVQDAGCSTHVRFRTRVAAQRGAACCTLCGARTRVAAQCGTACCTLCGAIKAAILHGTGAGRWCLPLARPYHVGIRGCDDHGAVLALPVPVHEAAQQAEVCRQAGAGWALHTNGRRRQDREQHGPDGAVGAHLLRIHQVPGHLPRGDGQGAWAHPAPASACT